MELEDGTAEPVTTTEPAQPADGQGAPTAADPDAFFDPSSLSPELQTQWKSMQAAYTKKMQKLAGAREAASIVERFNSDPDFARQTILQRAQQLGLSLGQPQQAGQQGSTSEKPPQEFVDAVRANLSPELQWMAPNLAQAQWAGAKMLIQPIKEQQAQTARSTRDQEYDTLAEQLSQKVPGWEEHEDDMDAVLAFLQSPKMTDRRFGSKLELLHQLVAGQGQANATAARRMADAARHRQPAGMPLSQPVQDVTEAVRKPKNNQDAWDVAAKHAIATLAKQGIKV
jgi:hypothetical protein